MKFILSIGEYMKYLLIYLVITNIIAFIVWCTDKYLACAGKRRICEKALFLWALIGGSIGSLCAMHLVRHKTRHYRFVIGIPMILALQAALLTWLLPKIF